VNKTLQQQLLFSQLSAFEIYKKQGIKAAEEMYPEHFHFIMQHKEKTYQEIVTLLQQKFNDINRH
jgi:hypothetical protein